LIKYKNRTNIRAKIEAIIEEKDNASKSFNKQVIMFQNGTKLFG